jgi:hypothetical protein
MNKNKTVSRCRKMRYLEKRFFRPQIAALKAVEFNVRSQIVTSKQED